MPPGAQLLVIDTDPGMDDAHALAMALGTAAAARGVAAVGTVAGNVDIHTATANARWLLAAFGAGAAAPLHRGAAAPLTGPRVDAVEIHGADGLGGAPRGAVPEATARPEAAAVALVEAARRDPGATTVVALGPLTNLALALRLEPRLPELLDRVVVMGGAIHGRGNLTLCAEFNIGADPAAADTVLAELPRVTLLPWETALAHSFTPAEFTAFFAADTPAARTLRHLTEHRMATDTRYAARTAFSPPDPMAMAVALDPEAVTRAERHRVYVGRGPGLDQGLTVVDWRDRRDDRPPVDIVTELDRQRLLDLLRL